MAHTCPTCGMLCHCNGDIDDICFGEADEFCDCCAEKDDMEEDEFTDDEIDKLYE